MAQLTIDFRGVCTHFWNNAIPGIGHRVVLPDATPTRAGQVTGPFVSDPNNPEAWLDYFIRPHLPVIEMEGVTMDAPGLMVSGQLITKSHLRIINTLDTGLVYDQSASNAFSVVPPLTAFLDNYAPSNDVVTGGRASAYFDILAGTISTFMDGASIRVRAIVETDGPPRLRITPMPTTDQPIPTVEITLDFDPVLQPALVIGNVSTSCTDGGQFDFLLHYLTDVGSIPRAFTGTPPGIGTPDTCPDPVETLRQLIEMGYPGPIKQLRAFATEISCSDSRYP